MTRDLSFERAIAFAQELIRIPSPSGDEGDVAQRVREELEALGFDDVWTDEVGNVLGRVKGTRYAPALMVNSHLDVVDAGDPAAWEHPPYEGVIADGALHGRGAMDIKGPLALQTYAVARFLDQRPDGDLIVAHTVLEERGGWGMAHLMASGAVPVDAVILGEATQGDICIGHRGRAELIVEAKGIAGHASAPERAKNALDLLPLVLPALQLYAEQLPADPVLGRSTLVATGVDTLPTSPNVIPDRARVVLDWRILPGLDPEAAVEGIEAFLRERIAIPEGFDLAVHFATERQHTYTGREEEHRLFTPGYLLPLDHAAGTAAAEAVRSATGRVPAIRPWRFATDGGYTCGVHGIPTIGYAPGEERHAHTNVERLELEPARVVYNTYPWIIRGLQRALEPS